MGPVGVGVAEDVDVEVVLVSFLRTRVEVVVDGSGEKTLNTHYQLHKLDKSKS